MRKPRINRSKGTRGLAPEQRERWLLEGATLVALIVVIIGVFFLSAIQYFVVRSGQAAAVISAVLVDLANDDRVSNSLGGLTMNPQLVAAAQAKADDMAAKGYFAHKAPDGKDSWYWFEEAGYSFSYAGENLAVDFSDSADVERAWMGSPTHRENLLDPHFTEIGIAVAQGTFEGRATTFVVQMFGAPAKTASLTQPIREVATPQDATEPALATTQSVATVLGTSAQEPAGEEPSSEPPADVRTLSTESAVAAPHYAPVWGFLATSPRSVLQYAYWALAFLVILALGIATGFELHVHHTRKAIAAGVLLSFIFVMFLAANTFVFTTPTLTPQASVANVAGAAF